MKICFLLTSELGITAFLLKHLRALSDLYDVTVVVNTNSTNFLFEQGVNAKVIPLTISRYIHLPFNLITLFKLITLLCKYHFDVEQYWNSKKV